MYRYVVVEYCAMDDENFAKKYVLGSYETMREARIAAGWYIKRNVKAKKEKYRFWQVDVQKEAVYFPIKEV